MTENVVTEFQADHSLPATGIVDHSTWQLINAMRRNMTITLDDEMLANTRLVLEICVIELSSWLSPPMPSQFSIPIQSDFSCASNDKLLTTLNLVFKVTTRDDFKTMFFMMA
jgi:hypothetical protein